MEQLTTPPKRPPGRPKGSQNKLQVEAKEVIAAAAACLGGTSRLIAWVNEDPKNEHAFWATIYPKLLPLTVTANGTLSINWPVSVPKIES
jgi:hypothetical protein